MGRRNAIHFKYHMSLHFGEPYIQLNLGLMWLCTSSLISLLYRCPLSCHGQHIESQSHHQRSIVLLQFHYSRLFHGDAFDRITGFHPFGDISMAIRFLRYRYLESTRHVFINDPHGQTHSLTSTDHYSSLKVVLFCEILKSGDGQTSLVKIVINIGRDCGSASWVNYQLKLFDPAVQEFFKLCLFNLNYQKPLNYNLKFQLMILAEKHDYYFLCYRYFVLSHLKKEISRNFVAVLWCLQIIPKLCLLSLHPEDIKFQLMSLYF